MIDESNGYDEVAAKYIGLRGRNADGIGVSQVRNWARSFQKNSFILDVGCGSGIPVTKVLVDEGMRVYAIDASKAMVLAFQKNFPNIPVACESVENSSFFNRTFDGIISIGLMFLLTENVQKKLIGKMAEALKPGGKLLFTSPRDQVEWKDILTGLASRSIGAKMYDQTMASAGLSVVEQFEDEGGNYYYNCLKQ